MSERQSAREVIDAEIARHDHPGEAATNTASADVILAALEADGFTVARLERVEFDALGIVVLRDPYEPLYRLAPTPQEHEPGESG